MTKSYLLTFETVHVGDYPPLTLSHVAYFYMKANFDAKIQLFSIFTENITLTKNLQQVLHFYVGDFLIFH